MNSLKSLGARALAVLPILGFQSVASAVVVYDSGSFEIPRFTQAFVNVNDPTVVGNLRGQDSPTNTWLESSTSPLSPLTSASGTAIVSTKIGGSGLDLQDVRVDRTQYENRWAASIPTITPTLSNNIVVVNWSQKTIQTTTDPLKYGPLFGIETYDNVGGPKRITGFGVDSTTGEMLYYDGATNSIGIVPSIFDAFNTYYDFEMSLNYTTGKYSVTRNGSPIISGIDFETAGVLNFTDADIMSLNADPVAINPAGTAYFDNYKISLVPEPATVSMLGLGAIALLRRSRVGRR